MSRHVVVVRTDVSEEVIACIINVTRISELETTLAVKHCSVRHLLVIANVVSRSLILFTLMIVAIRSSETSVLTRVTRSHILEDGILDISNGYNMPLFAPCYHKFSILALSYE
jgi:hypothetical protein